MTDTTPPMQSTETPALDKDRFRCPHCSIFAVQDRGLLLWKKLFVNQSPREMQGWRAHYCTACQEPTIWLKAADDDDSDMVYPLGSMGERASDDMPDEVRAVYEEARRVAALSRRSSAALLRLALQMLVDGLEPGAGSLNTKIGRLVERGLHPQTAQAMDVLRVVGNNAVHPGQIDLDDDPTLLPGLFRLTNVVIDQMISVPKHAESLFSALPQGARDQIAQRDGTVAAQPR
ncbi:DUF4145 domain-containing protein [Asanoa sp. NPDC050611]|uniref:DUF4145 domain-containing protein n=1 Tax=Asanoa sp. NPDC050611 TaxID=3157098 RepID=UPI0033F63248